MTELLITYTEAELEGEDGDSEGVIMTAIKPTKYRSIFLPSHSVCITV